MKKIGELVVGGIIAFSLLNPAQMFARMPAAEPEIGWYIDDRFENLYDHIEKNKVDPVEMIKEAFKEHNIVCVGEMHDDLHREFAIKYLKELSDVVDYFGVEVSTDYSDENGKLDYGKYAKDNPNTRQESDELAMQKAAIDAGIEVIALDEPYSQIVNEKTPRDETIKENIKKFKDKKILVWYGAHHVAKYDRGLEGIPFVRRLMNDGFKPYSILLLTLTNSERLSKTILFYSQFRNDTFALKDLDKIPEEVYNYNMEVKEIFMNFDAIIYYIPDSMKITEDVY